MTDWDYLDWLTNFDDSLFAATRQNIFALNTSADGKNKMGKLANLCRGTNVYLRPLMLSDTDMIISWRNDETIRPYFIYQQDFSREGHLRWIGEQIYTGKVHQFIIMSNNNDEALGSVFLRDIDRVHKKAELGIFLAGAHACGKGVGSEAIKLLLKYAFHGLGLHRIFLRVLSDNSRAVAVYLRAGFLQEAHLHDCVCIKGKYKDVLLMSILSD